MNVFISGLRYIHPGYQRGVISTSIRCGFPFHQ